MIFKKLCSDVLSKFKITVLKNITALTIACCLCVFPFTAGCSSTPNNDNGDDNSNSGQYSQLLQSVIEDDYCNTLIENAKNNTALYESGYLDPHPYEFLKQQGHDITSIKNNVLECYTMSYALKSDPNTLYVNTRVENTDGYYTNYLIKYQLSEKEMYDYTLTHYNHSDAISFFIQSVFMNDAISRTKTPTVVSKANIDKAAFNALTDEFSNLNSTKEMTGSEFSDIIFANLQTKTFDIYAYERQHSQTSMLHYAKIAYIPCQSWGSKFKITNGVYFAPTNYGGFEFTKDFSKDNTYKATLFTPQNVLLYSTYCKNLA